MVLPKLSGITLCASLLVSANTAWSQNVYCCQDPSSGRRVCGDILPGTCKGHAYKVYDRSGNIIREVGPPLTPEQKAAKAAEEQRKREQAELLREQRRKDAALLETYSSVKDIDLSLARAEREFNKAVQLSEERIEIAKRKRKKLESEAEFYKNRDMPPELARAVRETDDEIRSHNTVIASKNADLEKVRAKYAADRKRYQEIMSGGGQLNHPDAKRRGKATK